MRLIDADKAKEAILSWAVDLNNPQLLSKEDTLLIIDQHPTIEAEPVKHGRWVKENNRPKSYIRKCSTCGKTAYFCGAGICSYNYCPNCGAKMTGGAE